MLIDYIQRTGLATSKWLLQSAEEREEEGEWGWERLREDCEEDREEVD